MLPRNLQIQAGIFCKPAKIEFQIQKIVDSQMLKGINVEPSKSVNEFLISMVSKKGSLNRAHPPAQLRTTSTWTDRDGVCFGVMY